MAATARTAARHALGLAASAAVGPPLGLALLAWLDPDAGLTDLPGMLARFWSTPPNDFPGWGFAMGLVLGPYALYRLARVII